MTRKWRTLDPEDPRVGWGCPGEAAIALMPQPAADTASTRSTAVKHRVQHEASNREPQLDLSRDQNMAPRHTAVSGRRDKQFRLVFSAASAVRQAGLASTPGRLLRRAGNKARPGSRSDHRGTDDRKHVSPCVGGHSHGADSQDKVIARERGGQRERGCDHGFRIVDRLCTNANWPATSVVAPAAIAIAAPPIGPAPVW